MATELSPADQLEIQRVLALYGHVVDREQWDRLDEVFAADAKFEVRVPGSEGGLKGIEAIREAFSAVTAHRPHHSGNVVLTAVGDEVEALSKYFGPTADGRMFSGEFEDRFIRGADGWRIARRVVIAIQDPGLDR